MSDLVAFLTARLDEDEAVAKAAAGFLNQPEHIADDLGRFTWRGQQVARPSLEHIARHDPARVLRRVDATRKILALCETETDETGGRPLAQRIVRLLTAEWSNHPGHKPERSV